MSDNASIEPSAWRFDLGDVDDVGYYVPTYRQPSGVGSAYGLRKFGPHCATLREAFACLRAQQKPEGATGLGVRGNGLTIPDTGFDMDSMTPLQHHDAAGHCRRRQLRAVSSSPFSLDALDAMNDADLAALAGADELLRGIVTRRFDAGKFHSLLFVFGLLDAVPAARRVLLAQDGPVAAVPLSGAARTPRLGTPGTLDSSTPGPGLHSTAPVGVSR